MGKRIEGDYGIMRPADFAVHGQNDGIHLPQVPSHRSDESMHTTQHHVGREHDRARGGNSRGGRSTGHRHS